MICLVLVLLILVLVLGCVGWCSFLGGEFGDIVCDEVRIVYVILNCYWIVYDKCVVIFDDDCE